MMHRTILLLLLAGNLAQFPAGRADETGTDAGSQLPRKPSFGTQIGPVTKEVAERQKRDDTDGVAIVQVFPGTTAAVAGFKVGDVILSFNGSKVTGIVPFLEQLRAVGIGDTAAVDIVRDGEKMTKQMQMKERPRETSDAYDVIYGQVSSRGSRLRTIT